jgi:hypothetical protein
MSLASIALPGREVRFHSSTANTYPLKNPEKVNGVARTEDVKSELLFRF